MLQILVALVALAMLSAWVPAQAAPMNRPQAEYSADSTIQNEEGTIQQHVYVTPTKERKEILTGSGDGAVQIFRYDNKVMWMLMPSEKMYMEHSISGAPSKGNPIHHNGPMKILHRRRKPERDEGHEVQDHRDKHGRQEIRRLFLADTRGHQSSSRICSTRKATTRNGC